MEKSRSTLTSRSTLDDQTSKKSRKTREESKSAGSSSQNRDEQTLKIPRQKLYHARGDCKSPATTSHTQYFRKKPLENLYEKITTNQYLGISESISSSTDTFGCEHGPEGKKYTDKGLLKRNLLKEVDPIPTDNKRKVCLPSHGWEIAETIEFIVKDPVARQHTERLESLTRDFSKVASKGVKINILDSLCIIIDYLVETLPSKPLFRDCLKMLLKDIKQPILLNLNSDVLTYAEALTEYMGYLGYLLMRVEDDDLFDLVSSGLLYQLSAPDSLRGHHSAQLRHCLTAAKKVLPMIATRMIAIATAHRYPTYLQVAFILACDSVDNCLDMMAENIVENIFYRFNPYFPDRLLPAYEINPVEKNHYTIKLGPEMAPILVTVRNSHLFAQTKVSNSFMFEQLPESLNFADFRTDRQQPNLLEYGAIRVLFWGLRVRGASSVNLSMVLSLVMVLVKTIKNHIDEHLGYEKTLPCPDDYAQRCFKWAFRYECRNSHKHERNCLTVIIHMLINIFKERLTIFSTDLMKDILFLAVQTELPPRNDWTQLVTFCCTQADALFKKMLIYLSVDFLKIFHCNNFMTESQHWFVGMMYLIDPGLCQLRTKWSSNLFGELRKVAFQALLQALPLIPNNMCSQYSLIRRVMWYIEWYTESPYELDLVYWNVRLLQAALYVRQSPYRKESVLTLMKTHGVIVLMNLCLVLCENKLPPLEKSQSVIGLCLRLLTSAVEAKIPVNCCVYPQLKWPSSINFLVKKMMDIVLCSLDKHFLVSDRWQVSLLNLIWEAIIWRPDFRQIFIANNGLYQLLDMITMARYPAQCICLALICDIARAGDAVGQLVTWRANFGATYADPHIVARGATITTLLAALFKRDCIEEGIVLDEDNVIQDLDFPLMSKEVKKFFHDLTCQEASSQNIYSSQSAGELSGSRMAKCYAILQMLTEDLEYKVSLADEAYNLYSNAKVDYHDEILLVLCSHYLTVKLLEAWMEAEAQSPGFTDEDTVILKDFRHIGKGWAKQIQQQQIDIINRYKKEEGVRETALHTFLARVRLNMALDALREVRCMARSADRLNIAHSLLSEAVDAYHRRSNASGRLNAAVIRTYGPCLDHANIIGQNIKVTSIRPRFIPPTASHPASQD